MDMCVADTLLNETAAGRSRLACDLVGLSPAAPARANLKDIVQAVDGMGQRLRGDGIAVQVVPSSSLDGVERGCLKGSASRCESERTQDEPSPTPQRLMRHGTMVNVIGKRRQGNPAAAR